MLLCEDFLLLATAPDGRLLTGGQETPLALAGAVMAELAERGRVTVDERGRIAVPDATSTGDELLDAGLAVFAAKAGKRPKSVLPKVAKRIVDRVYARLAAAGLTEPRAGWLLKRAPLRDQQRRSDLWSSCAAVLQGARTPDQLSGSLIALVSATGKVPNVFPPDAVGLAKRDLKARAKQVGEGDWASEAVLKAIKDAQAAMMAAITASTVAASSGGSGG